ncbi:MAG: tetratricopeptide repeat protein [Magnetococcales bacterium]|nr:tetratricopeptide repeat protein [Magnetococcales bacterium]
MNRSEKTKQKTNSQGETQNKTNIKKNCGESPTNSTPSSSKSSLTIGTAYSQALESFNAGRYQEVDKYCTAIIKAAPNHIDAINLLGVVAQKANRHDMAIGLFQRAININDTIAPLYINLGISLYSIGQPNKALEVLEAGLVKNPGNRQITDYINHIKAESKLDSNEIEAQQAMQTGVALFQSGRLEEAMERFERANFLIPNNIEILSNIGAVLQSQGKLDEAIIWYTKAVKINPRFAGGYNNLAYALQQQGKFEKATHYYQKAIEIEPDSKMAHYNLANTLREQGKLSQAIEGYNKALTFDPQNPEIYNNLGIAQKEQLQFEEAILNCQKAIAIDPNYANAYNNIASTLVEQEQWDEAFSNYKKALAIKPDYVDAYVNMGMADLALGNNKEGWQGVEYRLLYDKNKHNYFSYPRWNGEPLTDKSILVYAEGGIGDEISGALLLNKLAAKAKQCIVLCDPRLVTMYTRSMPEIKFIGANKDEYSNVTQQFSHIDFQVAINSLPLFLSPDLKDLKPCIKADEKRVEYWRQKLDELGPEPKIGFSWTTCHQTPLRLSTHSKLEQWGPILTVKGATFINLYHGPRDKDINRARGAFKANIIDFNKDEIDLRDDIDELYSLMSALDMVVSSPSMVATLGVNLGSKVSYFYSSRMLWRTLGRGSILCYLDAKPHYFTNSDEFVSQAKKVGEEIKSMVASRR